MTRARDVPVDAGAPPPRPDLNLVVSQGRPPAAQPTLDPDPYVALWSKLPDLGAPDGGPGESWAGGPSRATVSGFVEEVRRATHAAMPLAGEMVDQLRKVLRRRRSLGPKTHRAVLSMSFCARSLDEAAKALCAAVADLAMVCAPLLDYAAEAFPVQPTEQGRGDNAPLGAKVLGARPHDVATGPAIAEAAAARHMRRLEEKRTADQAKREAGVRGAWAASRKRRRR